MQSSWPAACSTFDTSYRRSALPQAHSQPINSSAAAAPTWAKWVGIATALLLFTGFWNYIQFTKTYDLAKFYHMVLGIKMLAAIAVFLLAALLAGRTNAAEAIRQKWGLWINVCLFLALVTVVIGSVLRSFPHDRKVDAAETPKLVAPANQPAG